LSDFDRAEKYEQFSTFILFFCFKETANNSARMIYQGATASASAISHMRATLGIIDKICRNLLELKGDVKEFQMKCNFAKTVGATSNVAGAALGVGKLKSPCVY
jgi:hypothetical protein